MFEARTKEKWNAQKASYQDFADNYIDAVAAKVKVSVERDIEMWPYDEWKDGTRSFDEIIAAFKTFFSNRISWMDSKINSWNPVVPTKSDTDSTLPEWLEGGEL